MHDHQAPSHPSMVRFLPCVRSSVAKGLVISVLLASQLAPVPAAAQLSEPVDGSVVDTFRPPDHVGAPGNRGWEYQVQPGSPVRAADDGVVAFAGPIGAHLYVSIDHASGLRTSYSYLASTSVRRGDVVRRGAVVGTSAAEFHFGVRRGGQYVDPAAVVGGAGPAVRAHLVPVSQGPVLVRAPASLSGPPQYTLGLAHPWVR